MSESNLMKQARDIFNKGGKKALFAFLDNLPTEQYQQIVEEASRSILQNIVIEFSAEIMETDKDFLFKKFSTN